MGVRARLGSCETGQSLAYPNGSEWCMTKRTGR